MIAFLRLVGSGIAAVWLGGTVLYVLALDPLFGSGEFVRLLGPLHAGETGWLATERFQIFQVACAALALMHAMAEWLYSGRMIEVRLLVLLLALLGLGSLGKLWLTPRCRTHNVQAYLAPNRQILRQATTPQQRQAERSLRFWNGVLVAANWASLAGVGLYFLHVASPNNGGPRLFQRPRLRV